MPVGVPVMGSYDELPNEGDELLGPLAAGGVAGQITSNELLLGRPHRSW
ncbi:MAG: hypothetical protein ACYDDZ_14180 [Acidimicrobiales bacterium]